MYFQSLDIMTYYTLPGIQFLWDVQPLGCLCSRRCGTERTLYAHSASRGGANISHRQDPSYPCVRYIQIKVSLQGIYIIISFSIVCIYIYYGDIYIYIHYIIYIHTTHLHFPQSAHAIRTIPHLDGKGYRWI